MALAIALVAVFALVAVLAELAERLTVARSARRHGTTRGSAAWLMAPLLCAFGICSALLWPGLIAACHCAAHGLHHPHLCLRHPDYAAMMVVPAGIVVVCWLLLVAPELGRVGVSLWRTQRWSSRISRLPEQTFDSVRFRLIDAPGLGAATVGLFVPRIVVDSRLWHRLDDDERRALLHHEDAHRRRLDPLTLFVLEVCAALAVVPGSARLLARWRESVEKECDRHSAGVLASPESVASALLSLEAYHRDEARVTLPLGASAGGAELEVRVRSLLADEFSPRPVNLESDAPRVAFVGGVVAFAFIFIAGDWIHHATETALGLFVHHH
jgi:Zn-dependent protease with chaperone function